MKDLRVALVHDYLKEYGGAERVLETLHEIFPEAPVYTLVYLPKFLGPHRERFNGWDIRTSLLQYLPFKQKLISPIRLVSAFFFRRFDFSAYDVVFTSATGAYFPNALNKKKAQLVCYCHTPPRYLYGYATAREWKKHKLFAILAQVVNHFLRITDFNASGNVDQYIANSEEIRRRINKFYRKDAKVIYPPVEIPDEFLKSGKREYFLTGGRLARAKHVDLIIKAAAELDLPLKVFGKSFAGYGAELERLAGPKVEFLGEVGDEEKMSLMSGAKAFLFASEDEDFGIIPVEAMSAGTPVIAYRSGGVIETVVEGRTGLFFDELTVDALTKALKKFEKMKFEAKECQKQAEKFSKEKFMERIKEIVGEFKV